MTYPFGARNGNRAHPDVDLALSTDLFDGPFPGPPEEDPTERLLWRTIKILGALWLLYQIWAMVA